ncbi:unnamed protein product, partial [Amoebophrya sp. A120]|eukprot:GSA120T00016798001.1
MQKGKDDPKAVEKARISFFNTYMGVHVPDPTSTTTSTTMKTVHLLGMEDQKRIMQKAGLRTVKRYGLPSVTENKVGPVYEYRARTYLAQELQGKQVRLHRVFAADVSRNG